MQSFVRVALRIGSQALSSRSGCNIIVKQTKSSPVVRSAAFSSWLDKIAAGGSSSTSDVEPLMTTGEASSSSPAEANGTPDVKVEKVRVAACGDIDTDDEDDGMEQEEMFVDAYVSPLFEHGEAEWGGPRRGGRFPEPTRFGDWERKGRCSDF